MTHTQQITPEAKMTQRFSKFLNKYSNLKTWPHCSHSRDNLLSVCWKCVPFLINFIITYTESLCLTWIILLPDVSTEVIFMAIFLVTYCILICCVCRYLTLFCPKYSLLNIEVRQARSRESLGLRPLPDTPWELCCNYNKLERMGTSSFMAGPSEN
jgi:hypothetical protein